MENASPELKTATEMVLLGQKLRESGACWTSLDDMANYKSLCDLWELWPDADSAAWLVARFLDKKDTEAVLRMAIRLYIRDSYPDLVEKAEGLSLKKLWELFQSKAREFTYVGSGISNETDFVIREEPKTVFYANAADRGVKYALTGDDSMNILRRREKLLKYIRRFILPRARFLRLARRLIQTLKEKDPEPEL